MRLLRSFFLGKFSIDSDTTSSFQAYTFFTILKFKGKNSITVIL